MKIYFFLIINDKGSVRITKSTSSLRFNEISIAVGLEVPDAVFKKPQLSANIVVPDSAVLQQVVETTISDNFKAALQVALGTEVKINIGVANE